MNKTIEHEIGKSNDTSFGAALCDARKQKNIVAGRLAMKAGLYPTMLSNIEKGQVQPSISVACKILIALDIGFSDFFIALATSQGLLKQQNSNPDDEISSNLDICLFDNRNYTLTAKNAFGLLFKEFRTISSVTQKQVSEFTNYSIRNVQKVEAGTQNPSVMTALAMVCAVAEKAQTDISVFFKAYQEIYK